MIHFKSLCCALLLLSITGFAYAESHDKEVTQSIRLKILPDKVAEFEALVAQLVRDVHANEPGVKVYEIRRVRDQPLNPRRPRIGHSLAAHASRGSSCNIDSLGIE